MALHPADFLTPLSFLLICDLTSGKHHYRCPLLRAHCAPCPYLLCARCLYIISTSTVSVNPVQDKKPQQSIVTPAGPRQAGAVSPKSSVGWIYLLLESFIFTMAFLTLQ